MRCFFVFFFNLGDAVFCIPFLKLAVERFQVALAGWHILQDRDIAMHRFEAVSTSRRLEQTQADAQVVKEDVRVESQRQLLAQGELNDLEKSLQAACHQLMLSDQELERLQRALADRKQEVGGKISLNGEQLISKMSFLFVGSSDLPSD